MRGIVFTPVFLAVLAFCLVAQAPPKSPALQVHADLKQLMRGVLYPAANVVFSAQIDNPGEAKPIPGTDPSMATDPLHSTFGGWQAVENAALTLAESANLLVIPGRTCANGVAVPVDHPDWQRFVQELRDASMKAYKMAQAKNLDGMIEVADTMTTACAGCHRKWREKPAADRCE